MEPEFETVRGRLEKLEETIILNLIGRAQYKLNKAVYEPGKSGFRGYDDKSLFEIRLLHQEMMDAKWGRFLIPEERPFNNNLPGPERIFDRPCTGIILQDINRINLTQDIMAAYTSLIPDICVPGDDMDYGSSVECDVAAIRTVSERIHYGAFYVAECKYQNDKEKYGRLITLRDKKGLMDELTDPEVEKKILKRIYDKVNDYQKYANKSIRHTIDPEIIVRFYRNSIIPLTKKGEVMYLLERSV